MLLAEAVVGAANIGDPFTAFQMDALAEHGSAAVLAAEKSTVAQDLLRGRGAHVQPFPLRQHHLRLLPQLRRDDRREVILVTKLFFRLCEAESFVDFVPLTFVTDERAHITLVPENARYHSRVPEILLENDVLRVGQTLVQQFQLHERRCFSSLLIQCAGDGLHAAAADVGGEDQSDCFGRFLHDDNFLCVLVLEVAEGRDGHDPFLLLLPVAGSHTAAAVAGIEVIDQALEANDEIVIFVERIDIFRCREDTNIVLPQVVDEQRCLRPMTAKARQILD